MKKSFSFMILALLAIAGSVSAGVVDLAKSSGVQGGLIVHLNCGTGAETAQLRLDEKYLVHGLDADAAKVRYPTALVDPRCKGAIFCQALLGVKTLDRINRTDDDPR